MTQRVSKEKKKRKKIRGAAAAVPQQVETIDAKNIHCEGGIKGMDEARETGREKKITVSIN